ALQADRAPIGIGGIVVVDDRTVFQNEGLGDGICDCEQLESSATKNGQIVIVIAERRYLTLNSEDTGLHIDVAQSGIDLDAGELKLAAAEFGKFVGIAARAQGGIGAIVGVGGAEVEAPRSADGCISEHGQFLEV